MRVCLIFGGFIRKLVSSHELRKYLQAQFPDATCIDIYMCPPDTLDPDVGIPVNKEAFETMLREAGIGSIYVTWQTYKPEQFYEKAQALGFTSKDSNLHRYPPSRKLSMIYNYSKSVAAAAESGKSYDLAVLTRFDYVLTAQINLPQCLKHGVYLFRKYYLNAVLPCAEDRLFYGTPDLIFKIKDFYDTIHTIFKRADICCEELFSAFYWHSVDHDLLFFQESTELPINVVSEQYLIQSKKAESVYLAEHASKNPI
jgi:hypothetical protein